MSKVIHTLALVLFAAACSEPTAVSSTNPSVRASAFPEAESFAGGTVVTGSWDPLKWATSPGSSLQAATTFLGTYSTEVVSLSIPEGMSSLNISFDLYIIGSWDGAGKQNWGSDRWQLEVQRGDAAPENVFHTSFANQGTKPQNYPRQITDGGMSPAGFGAVAVNSLGYSPMGHPTDMGDTVYHMSFTVSNPAAGAVKFLFHMTTANQGDNDEIWGLNNVLVSGN
jgi:hypothetical protein